MTLDLPLAWLDRAFVWVWTTSLSTTVLVVIVAILQLLLRRFLTARWSHALWLCVLLRLIIPFVPATDFSIFNLSTRDFANIAPSRSVPVADEVITPPAREPPNTLTFQSDSHSAATTSVNPEPMGFRIGTQYRRILRLLPVVWVTGAISYFFLVVAFHYKVAKRLRHEQPIIISRIDSIIAEQETLLGIKSHIAVYETNRVNTPALFGFFKPRLLFPRGMVENVTDHELRLIILHELVHVKRRDVLLNWLVILVQSLHWFNPFVWLAFHRLRSSLEWVCDAAVLSHLDSEQRQAYGNTLIKLVDRFSTGSLAPGLISIINHENQIHRRITMIAKFKPTKRVVTIASALLLLALGCLTFTRAREKPPLAPPAAADVGTPAGLPMDPHQSREEAERRVVRLETMIQEQDEAIAKKQAQMDQIREKTGISESDAAAGPAAQTDTLRKLETLRLEALSESSQVSAVYDYLRNLPRASLLKTIPTSSPDPLLTTLMEQKSVAEQKLAQLSVNHGPEHPEMKEVRDLVSTITRQIDERLDGMLQGLKGKTESYSAKLRELQDEIDAAKKKEIQSSIARRPYLKAKRELEAMETFRDRLWLRLQEQRVDAALSK